MHLHPSYPGKVVIFILIFVGRSFISPVSVMCLPHNFPLVADMLLLHTEIRYTNENEVMVVFKGNRHTPNGGHFVYCMYIISC